MFKKRKKIFSNEKISIRTGRSWPQYFLVILLSIFIGSSVTFHFLNGGRVIEFILKIVQLENSIQTIEKEIEQANFELQTNAFKYKKITEDLTKVQEENSQLKEDILFYEKIIGKRKK